MSAQPREGGFWDETWAAVNESLRRGDSWLVWGDGYTLEILYHHDQLDESYFEGELDGEDAMTDVDAGLKSLADALPDLQMTPPVREHWKPALHGPAVTMALPIRPAQEPAQGAGASRSVQRPNAATTTTNVNAVSNSAAQIRPPAQLSLANDPNKPDTTNWIRAPFGHNTLLSRDVFADPPHQTLETPAAYTEDLGVLGERVKGRWRIKAVRGQGRQGRAKTDEDEHAGGDVDVDVEMDMDLDMDDAWIQLDPVMQNTKVGNV
jgi:hypothetical protein